MLVFFELSKFATIESVPWLFAEGVLCVLIGEAVLA
jgi:hypothetical protein